MAPERLDYRNDVANRLRRTRIASTSRRRRRAIHRGEDPGGRLRRAEQEVVALERKARRDSASIARRFDAICGVLRDRGHLDDWAVTATGEILARVYHESDLAVTDAICSGLLDRLSPPELASVVSCFTYEHRRPSPPPEPWFPSKTAADRHRELERMVRRLNAIERHHGVPPTPAPEAGFAPIAHAWAAGEELGVLLQAEEELTPGDFVRNTKQLVDLLAQIAQVAPDPSTAASARRASGAIHRGVVAISGSVEAP